MPKPSKILTTPDLIVLSLLAERPMHGYQINQELVNRDARDWADISRPQIYYSVHKLHQRKLIKLAKDSERPVGPDRQIYEPTTFGRELLCISLSDTKWALKRERPPFLTWLALSAHTNHSARNSLILKRQDFLQQEKQREEQTLKEIKKLSCGENRLLPAELMVSLTIRQFQTELDWLEDVKRKMCENEN